MATTLRNYLSLTELARLANITINDEAEALRQLDRAEQAIDAYVGFQAKHIPLSFNVEPTAFSLSGKNIFDTSNNTQLQQVDNYFQRCVVEIVAGTGAGQVQPITSSSEDNRSITVPEDWTTAPDTTSFLRIYQLGKFPRAVDIRQNNAGDKYYKYIPDAVKQAVVAQIEFIIAKGDAFFTGNSSDKSSESIGDYSYSGGAGGNQSSVVALTSPRARTLLNGIKNRLGKLNAENPTCL